MNKCPNCSSKSFIKFGKIKKIDIHSNSILIQRYRCRNCFFVFLDKKNEDVASNQPRYSQEVKNLAIALSDNGNSVVKVYKALLAGGCKVNYPIVYYWIKRHETKGRVRNV